MTTGASRRNLLVGVAATALHALAGPGWAEPGKRRLNILIFLTDDQNWCTVGYEGHPLAVTPNIDRLARAGVAFRNSFVTAPICASSRATLFSGTYLAHHKFNFSTAGLPMRVLPRLFPSLLREAGYRTGLVGKLGIWFEQSVLQKVGKHLGFVSEDAGLFDVYEPVGRLPYISEDEDGVVRHSLDKIELRARRFLRDLPRNQPFCLIVGFNAPHITERMDGQGRYEPAPRDRNLLPAATVPVPRLNDPEILAALPEVLKPPVMTGEEAKGWSGKDPTNEFVNYFRLIGGVDRVVGSVCKELDAAGLANDTVILFTSDNGLSMGDRGLYGKWSHFDESLRVPFILHDPGARASAGSRPEAFALNIDVPSTVLDYAGIDTPAEYRGRSLRPFAEGVTPEDWRTEFYGEQKDETDLALPDWIGIRSHRFAYAEYETSEGPLYFLTDTQADPDQLLNLADDPAYATRLEEYQSRARRYRKEYSL